MEITEAIVKGIGSTKTVSLEKVFANTESLSYPLLVEEYNAMFKPVSDKFGWGYLGTGTNQLAWGIAYELFGEQATNKQRFYIRDLLSNQPIDKDFILTIKMPF